MQGTNPLTMRCTYVTPCDWCTKWDKKCDKKIPERGLRVNIHPIDEVMQPCGECAHEDLDLPICDSCDITNNFKYFEGWEKAK